MKLHSLPAKVLPIILILFLFISIKIIHLLTYTTELIDLLPYTIIFIITIIVIILLICLVIYHPLFLQRNQQNFATNIDSISNQETAATVPSDAGHDVGDEMLMQCIVENWTHARHVEMEKLYFTSMYAVVIGAILTSLVTLKSSLNVNYALYHALIIFSMLFTTLGLLLTIRWSKVFEDHIKLVKKAANDSNNGVLNYISLPRAFKEDNSDHNSTKFYFSKLTRTKYMFYYFYISIFIMLIFLLLT